MMNSLPNFPEANEDPPARLGSIGPDRARLVPWPMREAALARRARQGDRQAFQDLYQAQAPRIHALLLGEVEASQVEDLVQEVFLTAWRDLQMLQDDEKFSAWLAGIARNRARQARRKNKRRPLSLVQEPSGKEAQDAPGLNLLAHLRELPEAYRETLLLRLVEGYSGHQIAQLTGLSPGSVRVNLHRGMKLLRQRLQQEGWP